MRCGLIRVPTLFPAKYLALVNQGTRTKKSGNTVLPGNLDILKRASTMRAFPGSMVLLLDGYRTLRELFSVRQGLQKGSALIRQDLLVS